MMQRFHISLFTAELTYNAGMDLCTGFGSYYIFRFAYIIDFHFSSDSQPWKQLTPKIKIPILFKIPKYDTHYSSLLRSVFSLDIPMFSVPRNQYYSVSKQIFQWLWPVEELPRLWSAVWLRMGKK